MIPHHNCECELAEPSLGLCSVVSGRDRPPWPGTHYCATCLVRRACRLAVGKDVLDAERELEGEEGVVGHVDEEHGEEEQVDWLAPRPPVGRHPEGEDEVGRQAEAHDEAEHDDPDPAAHRGGLLHRGLLVAKVRVRDVVVRGGGRRCCSRDHHVVLREERVVDGALRGVGRQDDGQKGQHVIGATPAFKISPLLTSSSMDDALVVRKTALTLHYFLSWDWGPVNGSSFAYQRRISHKCCFSA